MSGLTLRLADDPAFGLDLSEVLPEKLSGASIDRIRRSRLAHGKRRVSLGDWFEVDGSPGDTLVIEGATSKLRRIGRAMTSGSISVTGNVGDELGAAMTGGTISVRGSAADYAGAGLRGGTITISGNAGDFTGGALPNVGTGMREGVIRVGKNTGERAGDRMRRGLLIVNGAAGGYCGSNMIAGTIVVTGPAGRGIGLGMRRGTIVLLQEPEAIPATFNDCGSYTLAIMALLSRHVATFDRRAAARIRAFSRVRRLAGDVGCGGQGELLVAER